MISRPPEQLVARFGHRLRAQERLGDQTSFRIGGPAELFLSAESTADVIDGIALARASGIPWLVLGRGSNVLVLDEGVDGLVIRINTMGSAVDRERGEVHAEAGARMPTLAVQTAKLGLTGLEFAVGIPGSVGGAVVMNAGANQGQVSDVLTIAEILVDGEIQQWRVDELEFSYRRSRLHRERAAILLGAHFHLRHGDAAESTERVRAYRQRRRETQPTDPGAGSIFKNPAGAYAGALIEQAGLKGTQIGGAMISPKHGNFIVNIDRATSADVLALVDVAREQVRQRFHVDLELEMS